MSCSNYAKKQELKLGNGKRDPRWMWWTMSVSTEKDERGTVTRNIERPLASVPFRYGKKGRK